MSWSRVLLLAGVAFGIVVVLGSRFTEASVGVGAEGPTVTPSPAPNESSAG